MLSEVQIRWDAIAHVLALREKWWAAIPASALKSFISDGQQILLKGIQGIFKPKEISEPLSILSTLSSPYTDTLLDGQKILYDFAPVSRDYDNDGLKRCTEKGLPLIYFLQLKGKPRPEYQVFAPVKVVGWNDSERRFTIDLQPRIEDFFEAATDVTPISDSSLGEQIVKGYAISPVARRLHQAKFRDRILVAYRERCAVCVLRIRPLLDAAHVVADRDPKPTIVVNEGLSLCATHHRAFDAEILRYDDAYKVRIDLPEKATIGEGEQTMLLAFDGRPLSLPKDDSLWPVIST